MSFVYGTRPPLALVFGLGISLAAHGGAAHWWLSTTPPAPAPQPQEATLKGRDFIDLAPVEMLMMAPEQDAPEGELSAESKESLDSPEEQILAKAVNDPLLAQVPEPVEDPELRFRVANPLDEDQGDTETDEVPTEIQDENVEEMAEASAAAAPRASAGQDAQSGSAEEEVGLSDEDLARIGKWQQDMVLTLARAKVYPKAARRAKAQGQVVLGFALDSYGRVVRREILEGSGWPVLDQAALDLIDGFDRLPAPPAAMGAGPFDLRFPINYSFK